MCIVPHVTIKHVRMLPQVFFYLREHWPTCSVACSAWRLNELEALQQWVQTKCFGGVQTAAATNSSQVTTFCFRLPCAVWLYITSVHSCVCRMEWQTAACCALEKPLKQCVSKCDWPLFLPRCRTGDYKYKRGTTAVLTKAVSPLGLELVEESVQTMDTS